MGQANNRKRRFLQKHPTCCFCGGTRDAETIDHQPAKVFFDERQYPKEFEFPACKACNTLSSSSEQLLRLLVVPDNMDESTRQTWLKTVRYVRQTHPNLIENIFPSTRQIRTNLKDMGAVKNRGELYSDVPMVMLDPDVWEKHFQTVGRKLALAMHYQCFSQPLSSDGEIWLLHRTNANAKEMTSIYSELTENLAIPIAQGKRIGNQFSFRWGVARNKSVAAWAMHLHMRVFYFAVTIDDPDWLQRSNEYMFGKRLKPFSHE